ncbi:MAG: BON domain-containing protein [Methanosarcinaceae archaeon]|nr:BON domain-containing protein [Methanosarcinaceae archaeon]
MKPLNKKLVVLVIFTVLGAGSLAAMAADRPSDNDIKFWVKNAISEDPQIDTTAVKVEVLNGIVTLSGEVGDLAAKNYADLEAKKVSGVLGVINKLTVSPSYIWDTDIAQIIRHRIINSAAIESENINVVCIDGKIKLSGDVTSWSEKEEAGLLASEVRGVKDVQNNLIVNWKISRADNAIEKDVRACLKRDVYLIDLPIDVSVKNGVVTLSGTVGSEYQKNRAYNDARWVNNVTGVNNNLKVEWWEKEGTRTKALYPTDNKLVSAVIDELLQDSRLDPLDLTVTASYGHVTLIGSVANYYQKKIAEADVHDVIGVGWVTNDLVVRSVKREDFRIRDDILFDISTDNALWHQGIEVKVNSGVVSLSGKVDTPYEKEHAKTVASRIRGVREVNNKITVDRKQGYKDAALLGKVENRIQWNELLSPVKDKIKVNIRKGIATLTGTVYNWGERREAERVAFKTNGIWMVDNRLQVEGYNYSWEDWYLTEPDDISWFDYYDYPYGYYWDIYPFPSKSPAL